MADDLMVAVLAAGASRRLGRPKQLILLGDEPLIRRQCRVALEAGLGPVAVVLGCQAPACREALAGLDVETIVNDGGRALRRR